MNKFYFSAPFAACFLSALAMAGDDEMIVVGIPDIINLDHTTALTMPGESSKSVFAINAENDKAYRASCLPGQLSTGGILKLSVQDLERKDGNRIQFTGNEKTTVLNFTGRSCSDIQGILQRASKETPVALTNEKLDGKFGRMNAVTLETNDETITGYDNLDYALYHVGKGFAVVNKTVVKPAGNFFGNVLISAGNLLKSDPDKANKQEAAPKMQPSEPAPGIEPAPISELDSDSEPRTPVEAGADTENLYYIPQ